MSTTTSSETYEVHVKGVINSTSVQDAKDAHLSSWETRLSLWEKRLDLWEKRLLQKEAALDACDRRAFMPASVNSSMYTLPPGRLACESCGKGMCSRSGPCYTPTGVLPHKHHHCRKCHDEYRHTGQKGSGRSNKDV